MRELRGYQKDAVTWLRSRTSSILADEMGTGKTLTCIHTRENNQPMIVVCPKSLKSNWKLELEAEGYRCRVLNGKMPEMMWPEDDEVLIMNYDILPKVFNSTGCPSNLYVVADEFHYVRNPKLIRSAFMCRLAKTCRALRGRFVGVTGTPLLTSPYDLYGVLFSSDLLHETYKNFTNFCRDFQGVRSQFGMKWIGPRHPSVLAPLKKVMLRRTREDVAKDIPVKSWNEVEVKLPHALHYGVRELAKEENEEIIINRVKLELSTWRKDVELVKAHGSIELIKDMMENGPVVVFAEHRESVNLISTALNCPSITGETSEKERAKIVEDYKAGNCEAIVGTIGAMGVGLTLVRGHQVVMIGRSWTPALNAQAEDRVCRMGQTRGVVVTDIISDSYIDRLIKSNLLRKQMLIDSTVETIKEKV